MISINQWDGKSDVLLIVETDKGYEIKQCPAEVMRRVLSSYRKFYETHQLVLDSKIVEDHLIVTCRWDKNK